MESQLDLGRLRTVLDRLLDEAERIHGQRLALDADSYWVVTAPAAFDVHQAPEPTLGSLEDDLAELAGMTSSSHEFVLWHDLEHVIGLLRRIAALDAP